MVLAWDLKQVTRFSVPFAAGRQAVGQQRSECREEGHNLQSLNFKIQQEYQFHIIPVISIVSWSENSDYEQLATGWTVRGSNPGEGKISRNSPDRPWGPPSLLYNAYRAFPGGKAAGTWRSTPPQLAPRLKKE